MKKEKRIILLLLIVSGQLIEQAHKSFSFEISTFKSLKSFNIKFKRFKYVSLIIAFIFVSLENITSR